jgi:hypothetical protein
VSTRWTWLVAAVALASACSASGSRAGDPSSTATPTASAIHARPTALDAKGIEPLRFGVDQATAEATLTHWFGQPRHALVPSHLPPACGYDRTTTWPALTAYYFRGVFVGYFYRGGPGAPALLASDRIRVGLPLARAEAFGGADFHRSYSLGGSWTLRTPAGKVGGLLTGVPPKGNIENIEAGSLGCQMMVS